MPHVVNFRQGHAASNLHVRSPQNAQAGSSSSSVFSASADTSVTTAQSTANPYVTEIVHHAAGTTVALAVIVAILAVIIIVGSFVFRFKLKKARSELPRTHDSREKDSIRDKKVDLWVQSPSPSVAAQGELEKPKAVYNTTADTSTGWAPQIKEYNGVQVSGKQFEKNMASNKARAKWEKAVLKDNMLKPVSRPTTPPTVSVQKANSRPITPPTTYPASDNTLQIPGAGAASEPLPSPARSASFGHQQSKSVSSTSTSPPVPKGAKMMTVVNTFIKSLDDELHIQFGDTLRMFEEYNDGWCLCQHVGNFDSPKGVVPRFCLQEKAPSSPPMGGRSLTGQSRF